MSSPSKVEPRHTRLRAIIYIRQSTPQQVLNNQEGTRRQYQLVERARQMGWPDANIRVILNYTDVLLHVPSHVDVHRIDPTAQLMHTLYYLTQAEGQEAS